MPVFPLSQIPYGSLTAILGKMPFKEASRMRQTCHQMEKTIAKSRNLAFPLHFKHNLLIYLDESPREKENLTVCISFMDRLSRRGGKVRFGQNRLHIDSYKAIPATYSVVVLINCCFFILGWLKEDGGQKNHCLPPPGTSIFIFVFLKNTQGYIRERSSRKFSFSVDE